MEIILFPKSARKVRKDNVCPSALATLSGIEVPCGSGLCRQPVGTRKGLVSSGRGQESDRWNDGSGDQAGHGWIAAVLPARCRLCFLLHVALAQTCRMYPCPHYRIPLAPTYPLVSWLLACSHLQGLLKCAELSKKMHSTATANYECRPPLGSGSGEKIQSGRVTPACGVLVATADDSSEKRFREDRRTRKDRDWRWHKT